MVARLTQEAVEVLGLGDGKLRVTRLAVEVLAAEPDLYEASDSLAFSDEAMADLNGTFEGPAEDSITLSDEVEAHFIEIFALDVEDTLGLGELASQATPVDADDTLTLTDTAEGFALAEFDGIARDFMVFRETLGEFRFGEATDTLTIADVIPPTAPEALVLTETIVATRIKTATVELEITDEAARQVVFSREPSDNIPVTEAVSAYIPRSCDRKRNVAAIRNLFKGHVVFTLVNTPKQVTLRNPQWGDRESLNFSRINRTTRGGTRIVFSDPTWPKFTGFTLDFTLTRQDMVTELSEFLLDSLGQEVQFSDWTGRYFLGLITNPDAVISQTDRKRWECTILFEGAETTTIFAISSDTLITEELDRQVDYGRDLADMLTIADTTDGDTFRPEPASDDLDFTDESVGIRYVFRSVADTIVFTDSAARHKTAHRSGTDSLAITDTATRHKTAHRTGIDSLAITDTATGDNETRFTGIPGKGIVGWDFMLGEDP